MKSNFELAVKDLGFEEKINFKRFCRYRFKVRKSADLRNLSPSILGKYLRIWKECKEI